MTQATATTRRLEGYARRRGLTVGISRYSTGEYGISNRDGVPLSHPRRLGYTAAEAESAIEIEAHLNNKRKENPMSDTIRIDLSLCPTLFDNGWSEEAVLNSIKSYAEARWPGVEFVTLQVGYRQGGDWCCVRVNGILDPLLSDSLWDDWSHSVDGSDESLYPKKETAT